jgi:ABC-2 type transport system permease protein
VLATYVLDTVGGILEIPERILELGPFRHLAAVPAADLAVGAALVMLVVGLVAAAVGAWAFRHRDLQEA